MTMCLNPLKHRKTDKLKPLWRTIAAMSTSLQSLWKARLLSFSPHEASSAVLPILPGSTSSVSLFFHFCSFQPRQAVFSSTSVSEKAAQDGNDISPKICLQKGLKIVFFAQKTPDFGPKNRLRIWGVPPSPPLRIFFSAKRDLRIWGVPPPPRLRTKSAK